MNIVMITNTYLPMIGGETNSVVTFTEAYRRAGHRVLVIAPEFDGMDENEEDVVRVPAIRNFNGSDFSLSLPAPLVLTRRLHDFRPDVVHSHHPYLLGDSALRVAAKHDVPIVFTYHTQYEHYTHYVPADSGKLKRFVIELAVRYCNACDHVVVPSESTAGILRLRGVTSPMSIVPTGVDVASFSRGDGRRFRSERNIPDNAFVAGHVGRLALEKNCAFLARSLAQFVAGQSNRLAMIVGYGPSREDMRREFARRGVEDRLIMTGAVTGASLVGAYHAMDVFAFASRTETQGMVLAEAMAAGVPVVALDAPGAREVVRDRMNGRLLHSQQERSFVDALEWVAGRPIEHRNELSAAARRTSLDFESSKCASKVLSVYDSLIRSMRTPMDFQPSLWSGIHERIRTEWDIWSNRFSALSSALSENPETTEPDSEKHRAA